VDPAKRLKMIGARVLSEANDLKRTPAALASEMGVETRWVDAVIRGDCSLLEARDFVFAMSETLPVAIADLWVDEDVAVDGVHVMTAAQSTASTRIFDRAARHGGTSPYYEYRDTAMLRGGPFRPEWIRMLRVVEDDDPNNPDVVFNNGHLLHQITFFSGAVNFYWEENGERRCRAMTDGGSNSIPPFVPHSFTTRKGGAPGLIIAVTFAGEMRRNVGELQRLPAGAASALAGPPGAADCLRNRRDRWAAFTSEPELLVDRPEGGESACARMPGTSEGDSSAVLVLSAPGALSHAGLSAAGPQYRLRPLAASTALEARGFLIEVVGYDGAPIRHHLHQYVYNIGDAPVLFTWGDGHRAVLASGDSACCLPGVLHKFLRLPGEPSPTLVLIRTRGRVSHDVLNEFGDLCPEARDRVVMENRRWF